MNEMPLAIEARETQPISLHDQALRLIAGVEQDTITGRPLPQKRIPLYIAHTTNIVRQSSLPLPTVSEIRHAPQTDVLSKDVSEWSDSMVSYVRERDKRSFHLRSLLQDKFHIDANSTDASQQFRTFWKTYFKGEDGFSAFVKDFVGNDTTEDVEQHITVAAPFFSIFATGGSTQETIEEVSRNILAYAMVANNKDTLLTSVSEHLYTSPLEKKQGENFGGVHFYPDRLVPSKTNSITERMITLENIISEYTQRDREAAGRLWELIVYNGCGRIFPIPNSAGDFIPVIDDRGIDTRYKNVIALIKRKDGKLAIPGGFNDMGESMVGTIAREGREEIDAKRIENLTFIGETSNPNRDARLNVISTAAAGVVKKDTLHAKDDAASLVIVPLEVNGNFNPELLQTEKGTITDVEGNKVEIEGVFMDHGDILDDFYSFWRTYGKLQGLSLRETLSLRAAIPQEWYENVVPHPEGIDTYDILKHEGQSVLLTPHIQFVLGSAEKIVADSGISSGTAQKQAEAFVAQLVGKDILPQFPQAAVTVDCVVVDGDNLVVHKLPDGRYALPGSFYAPEKVDVGASVNTFARQLMNDKYHADFRPLGYLGQVGGVDALGHQADDRYPRLSHVVVGHLTNAYAPKPGTAFLEGTTIERIPIWEDRGKGSLSANITESLWAFEHNKEILATLFLNNLNLADPRRRFTAEQAFRHPEIASMQESMKQIWVERQETYRVPSFTEWEAGIRVPPNREIYRESIRDLLPQVGLFGSIIGGEEYRKGATEIMKDLAGDEWQGSFIYDPTVSDREHRDIDAENEANALAKSVYIVDVIESSSGSVGSMVEAPMLALYSLLFERPVAYKIEGPGDNLPDNEKRARKQVEIDMEWMERMVPEHVRIFRNQTMGTVMEDAWSRVKSRVMFADLDEERHRVMKSRSSVIPRITFSGSSKNQDREELLAFWKKNKLDVIDTYKEDWDLERDYPEELEQKYNSLVNVVDIRDRNSLGALKDINMAVLMAVLSGTFAIIHVPQSDPSNPDAKTFNRARRLVDKQFERLATQFPWIHQYVRFVDSTEEIQQCTEAIFQNYPSSLAA